MHTTQAMLELLPQIQGGNYMLRLRVLEILDEQHHTKYWLYKQMDLSYQNFSKLVNNETKSIRFDNLEKLSKLLNCSIDDLFERIDIPDADY